MLWSMIGCLDILIYFDWSVCIYVVEGGINVIVRLFFYRLFGYGGSSMSFN